MKLIKSSEIKGTVAAPPSKSMMQRALAAALLTEGTTKILNPTFCNDSLAALQVIEALGAKVTPGKDEVKVTGGVKPVVPGTVLNCGESGLAIRMFSPVASLWHEELMLTGEGSLLTRPMEMIEGPLKELGVAVTTANGCPPLKIKGPLLGGEAEVDGSVSSQFLTGLLMALPMAARDSRLIVKNLRSKPYIDMTLSLLASFGIQVSRCDYETFSIAGSQAYVCRTGEYWIEGDWSGVSFLLVAGALAGSVTVDGMNILSRQADRKILDALIAAGGLAVIAGDSVTACKLPLQGFVFDATHCPDLFPPLVVLACNCRGKTKIKGVERLVHKESNRAMALVKEFSSLGARIHINGNWLEIEGTQLHGGVIDSHNDHRIAMAAAVAALNANGDVIIHGDECIAKSYPGFFEDLKKIGGNVHE
ncbi:MAG: 3-phosphoshikimate 1-carboxyvinyltransferase [Acidobacteria bacterium]|jgi:3-phosphoshikimate 1-carboxyvinyltransferase|nr:3-phosphoshikimate 1-carboxyvinyltransferase [Acidobacteriota bacterium]